MAQWIYVAIVLAIGVRLPVAALAENHYDEEIIERVYKVCFREKIKMRWSEIPDHMSVDEVLELVMNEDELKRRLRKISDAIGTEFIYGRNLSRHEREDIYRIGASALCEVISRP